MSIAESIHALKEAKTNIANAIAAKGGTVNEGDGFSSFAAGVNTIPANPIVASSEDEANALLVENNVGRIFKYTGEGGGAAAGTPPTVGDTTPMTLYFNTSVTPDFEAIKADSSVIKGADIHPDWANAYFVLAFGTESGEGGGYLGFYDMSEMQEGLFLIADSETDNIIYVSQDVTSEGITAGWHFENIDVVTLISHGATYNSYTVKQVGGQDLWSSYISKEPFAAGGGAYEKDALYLITEGGSSNAPIAAGDTPPMTLYFNTDVTPDFEAIKNDSTIIKGETISGDFENWYFCLDAGMSSDSDSNIWFGFFDANEFVEGCFLITTESMETILYSNQAVPDMGIQNAGWQMSEIDILTLFDVPEDYGLSIKQVGGQDLWGAYISKEPFTSGGGGVAAKKLQIAE